MARHPTREGDWSSVSELLVIPRRRGVRDREVQTWTRLIGRQTDQSSDTDARASRGVDDQPRDVAGTIRGRCWCFLGAAGPDWLRLSRSRRHAPRPLTLSRERSKTSTSPSAHVPQALRRIQRLVRGLTNTVGSALVGPSLRTWRGTAPLVPVLDDSDSSKAYRKIDQPRSSASKASS